MKCLKALIMKSSKAKNSYYRSVRFRQKYILRCLNLLETPTDGEIYFDGQLITDKKCDINKVREHMGMVFSILIFSIIKPYLKILLLHLFSLKL